VSQLNKPGVVKLRIDSDVKPQSIRDFGGAPSLPKESIDVGSKHRAGVIEAKKRIKAYFFKLPLSDDRSSLSFESFMN
jgi:hypothetical protein